MAGLAIGAIGSALQSLEPNASVAPSHRQTFNAALDRAGATPAGGAFTYAHRPIIDIGSGAGTVIPAAGTDPKSVSAWWASLSAATRQKLMAENYEQLGKLRGLPAADIDTVNRKLLDADIRGPQQRLHQVEFEIGARQDATKYGNGQVDPELSKLYRERDHLREILSNPTEMKKQMDILDADYAKGKGPKPYLLTYDPTGDGRFGVALGNPDTADNTTVLVPGAGHDVKKEDGHEVLFPTVQEGLRLYDAMGQEGGRANDNSVIVWLGTDMPDSAIPGGLNPTYGDPDHGARWLHDDVAGYQAAITNLDNHMTLLAHSYGSYMASQAVKLGLRVDDLVVFGSPGLVADNAGELGMQGHVWAGRADQDDLVTHGWLGSNPTSESFGAEVFATGGAKDHNDYLNDRSESLENIAKIATGQGKDVSRREPDPERTPFDYMPTGTT